MQINTLITILRLFSLVRNQIGKLVFSFFVAQNDLTSSKYKRNKSSLNDE